MNVLIPIAEGSESLETVAIANLLRRAEIAVTMASIHGRDPVTGTRAIKLVPDAAYAEVANADWDAVIVPGGEPGARALGAHPPLIEQLLQRRREHRWFGAICAAPALTFAPHGLLDGKQATCHPNFREQLLHWVNQPVVVDGHCITSQGPATAIGFALEWIEQLAGSQRRHEVGRSMLAEA